MFRFIAITKVLLFQSDHVVISSDISSNQLKLYVV